MKPGVIVAVAAGVVVVVALGALLIVLAVQALMDDLDIVNQANEHIGL